MIQASARGTNPGPMSAAVPTLSARVDANATQRQRDQEQPERQLPDVDPAQHGSLRSATAP